MNTNNKSVSTAPMTLELFQFTQPAFPDNLLKPGSRKDSAGKVTGLSLTVESRKTVAKSIGQPSKSRAVVDAMMGASDAIKKASLDEVMKIAASPDWTGGAVRVSIAKNGTRRATFAFKTCERGPNISKEQLAAVLSKMTDEEQTEILNAALEMAKSTIEVPALDDQKAELEVANA